MRRFAIAVWFSAVSAYGTVCTELFTPHSVQVAGWEIAEESAAEAELPLEDLLPWLDTNDGTLGPVLEMRVPPPAWLARSHAGVGRIASWIPSKRQVEVLKKVPWGALSPTDKVRLIVDLHTAMASLPDVQLADRKFLLESLWPDRIPGLRLHPRTDDWAAPFLSEYLGYVFERTNARWGEAHLRGPFSPGQARAAMFRLFPTSPSVHVHCPVPLAVAVLKEEGLEGAALRTDLMLRANAFAELLTALYRGASIHAAPRHGRLSGSAPLTSEGFGEMARYFLRLSDGYSPQLPFPWLTKNAFVGLRQNELYDRSGTRLMSSPSPNGGFLFVGLEHRFLRRGKAGLFGEFPENVLPVVDEFMEASRRQLRTGDYGELRPKVRRWMGRLRESHPAFYHAHFAQLAKYAWYRTSEAFEAANLPAHLTDVVDPLLLRKLIWEFNFAKHEELAMLTFDWNRIALLAFSPTLATQVAVAQRDACQRVRRNEDLNAVVRHFIWKSGLLHALAASFGLEPKALPLPMGFAAE